MNYIYDVITNFFEEYIEFFEWEKNDNYLHFKRIPIIKINNKYYNTIITHNIKMDNEILKKIKNKSEIFYQKIDNNNYYILITNGKDIIALLLNQDGISIKRSSLYVDEELDILQTIKKINYKNINYTKLNKISTTFKTRNTLKKQEYLKNQLKRLSTNKDTKKIHYLYYECFNKNEKNINKALHSLIKNINNKIISDKLYDFFKLYQTIN